MSEAFAEILMSGGHKNSLGRAGEVIEAVSQDKDRLEELYTCVFDEDAWVRMRAIDAIEKICREYPDWIKPYVDRFQNDLGTSEQASVQWHLAQMYQQLNLSVEQKRIAISWLKQLLSTKDVDWIACSYAMETLVQFVADGSVPKADALPFLKIQTKHKSKAVVKRANKLIAPLQER